MTKGNKPKKFLPLKFGRNNDEAFILSIEAQKKLLRYRQKSPKSLTNGGSLFAEIAPNKVIIKKVSIGPYLLGSRDSVSFRHDRKKLQKLIERNFAKNLHYVGDWFSQPRKKAFLTSTNQRAMEDQYEKSAHELNAMILITIGNKELEHCCATIHNLEFTRVLNILEGKSNSNN